MENLIGTTAGRIWQYLEKNGAVSALKLKSALGVTNSLLYLSLGWLAREGKIEISETEHTYKIILKP